MQFFFGAPLTIQFGPTEQGIDSNRNSTALADNDNAPRSNSGVKARAEEQLLISPENSLSGQVLTLNQSSMSEPVLTKDKSGHKYGLNQDLLPTSNYLNTKCNQADSENNQLASAKCKQMDAFDLNVQRGQQHQLSTDSLPLRDRWPQRLTTTNTLTTTLSLDEQVKTSDYKLTNEHDLQHGGASPQSVRDQDLPDSPEWSSTPHTSFQAGLSSTCQSVIYRSIEWPQTVAGSVAIRSCPQEASGRQYFAHLLPHIMGD